jgi:cephalosporin hydroxylase
MTNPEDDPITSFKNECAANIAKYKSDLAWQNDSERWLKRAFEQKFMYNFTWMGRPIIQLPNDIVAMQELIWQVKPDLVIETGIAHGGSLIMSASVLALIDMCDAIESNSEFNPRQSKRMVLGVDIDIRSHNREAIQAHPMASRISMIQGSSIAVDTVQQVHHFAQSYKRVLVCLDSNHTHDHVLAELESYAPLVSQESYCVVFDTIVEDMPAGLFPNRPWNPGNNPKTAVVQFLKQIEANHVNASDGARLRLQVDHSIDQKLLISVAPSGFLKRVD